ncbi:hypothetical protein EUGRSUZ_J02789 [Eucalyptus grandis]|uniref:Uncharacterized protein n=2 Tax=Eucalyptus grandis TaxID=71139 RepID=A0ACC3J9M1_EUCGR|nr:hypothetical protein EUGRSUZ_J02789 [Eucalyptus grandis]
MAMVNSLINLRLHRRNLYVIVQCTDYVLRIDASSFDGLEFSFPWCFRFYFVLGELSSKLRDSGFILDVEVFKVCTYHIRQGVNVEKSSMTVNCSYVGAVVFLSFANCCSVLGSVETPLHMRWTRWNIVCVMLAMYVQVHGGLSRLSPLACTIFVSGCAIY